MKNELILGLVVIVLLVTSIFVFRKTPHVEPQTHQVITVVTDPIHESSASVNYMVSVDVPELDDFPDMDVAQKINTSVEKKLKKDIEQFKQTVDTTRTTTKLPAALKKAPNEYTVTYETIQATDMIVSYKFTVFESIVGMAHPTTTPDTFNYDVKGNRELTLKDVFKPNSKYLEKLSEISRKNLTVQLKSIPNVAALIQEGTVPNRDNFQFFTLSSDALILYFIPSQVAPSFAGTQSVTIPYSQISDIVNPLLH